MAFQPDSGLWPPLTELRDYTHWTPPDERSAIRIDLYLTTHNTHNTQHTTLTTDRHLRPGGIRTSDSSRRAGLSGRAV